MKRNYLNHIASACLIFSVLMISASAADEYTPVVSDEANDGYVETITLPDESHSQINEAENQTEIPLFTVDGEMSVYAGTSYRTLLTSTNEDYANGILTIDFIGSNGCEKISVEVEVYNGEDWETLSTKTISYESRKSFSPIKFYQQYRINIKCADNNPSNVVLYVELHK